MPLTSERWQRVRELLAAAREMPHVEIETFLEKKCGDDRELRDEVESLLQHENTNSFLKSPAINTQQLLGYGSIGDAFIGKRIGNYVIKRLIGEGGMGAVFEAEQDSPHRTVALKIMKRGIMSRNAYKRFRHETELLGQLQHPGIAQIYDAGTHDDGTGGVPYFAMEYISHALTLTEYAEKHDLSMHERLELFTLVCDAVHYGHQKSIIHRDLKPANILVFDEVANGNRPNLFQPGLVKIIDFGVARATDSDVAVTTMQTETGVIVGTLQYMSPEQVDGDLGDVDTRSDVYSLGVVLYEFLTGGCPFELSNKSLTTAIRLLGDREPTPPSSFTRLIRKRGDVETIILKALSKNREKRYQSAADFAQDVHRYLNGEPIEARPPTRWMRVAHWIARHPIVVTLLMCLAVVFLTVPSTFVSVWWLNLRPSHISINEDRTDARLESFAGRIIHRWTTSRKQGIGFAQLVNIPSGMPSNQLVLLAFDHESNEQKLVGLYAFDPQRGFEYALWSTRLEDGDLPERLLNRGDRIYKGSQFSTRWCALFDIFGDSPGLEIVAIHQHNVYSQCCARIYDLNGNTLFQLWHDGNLSSAYWLPESGILVFTGVNAETFWENRGAKKTLVYPHPPVIFAVKPRLGLMNREWIVTGPNQTGVIPEWYKCVWPPLVADIWSELIVRRPPYGQNPLISAEFSLRLKPPADSSIPESIPWLCWSIDGSGNEVPNSRIIGDVYKRTIGLPDPSIIELRDLPPVVSPDGVSLDVRGLPQPELN